MKTTAPIFADQATEGPPAIRLRRLRLVLACVLTISFVLEFVFWAAFLLSPLSTRMDFRRLYVAGYMVRSGHADKLYDHEVQRSFQNALVSPEREVAIFDHLPFGTLWFVPFSLLPYKYAYFAWLLVNLLLLTLSFHLLSPWIQPTMERAWLAPTMFLLFLPVQVALMQGQDSILLLLLSSTAFVLLQRNRHAAAGAITALGMFKFQIVLPLALLFLLKRRFRFAIAFGAVSAALGVLSTYLVGVTQMRVYWKLLTHMSLDSGQGSFRESVIPADIATLRGLISVLGTPYLGARTIQICAVGLSVLLLLVVAISVPKAVASSKLIPIFVLASVLAGYHVLTHDLSIAILPVLFVLGSRTRALTPTWPTYSAIALFSAPLVKFVLPHQFYLVSLVLIEFLAVMVCFVRNDDSFLAGELK